MLSAESFQSFSLRNAPEGQAIARILAASIQAVEPGAAVERVVSRAGDVLQVAGVEYRLPDYRQVKLLGIGKAALAMSACLAGMLDSRLESGLVVTKHAPIDQDLPFEVIEGDHPIPGAHSLSAGVRTQEFVSRLCPDDLLFCLISGGGSALVTTPLQGISLDDMQAFNETMLASGARIDEINILRRRLERTKGGGLVRLANGARIVSLILSDVIGSPLEAIASGPTAPDPAKHADAQTLLEKYGLRKKLPASILTALETPSENPAADDPVFERVQNLIVGNGLLAAQAALAQAKKEGFNPYLLRIDLQGEARQAAFELATYLRQAWQTGAPVPAPACILAGGETTVTLAGNGLGGRNTELALASAIELEGFPGVMLVALATDGEDGATDAAGAVVTGETFQRAIRKDLDPLDFLERNDSYSFFAQLEDLLKPGSTGTNVNDLVFLFVL